MNATTIPQNCNHIIALFSGNHRHQQFFEELYDLTGTHQGALIIRHFIYRASYSEWFAMTPEDWHTLRMSEHHAKSRTDELVQRGLLEVRFRKIRQNGTVTVAPYKQYRLNWVKINDELEKLLTPLSEKTVVRKFGTTKNSDNQVVGRNPDLPLYVNNSMPQKQPEGH
jgi:hypothetical protein